MDKPHEALLRRFKEIARLLDGPEFLKLFDSGYFDKHDLQESRSGTVIYAGTASHSDEWSFRTMAKYDAWEGHSEEDQKTA